MTDEIHATADDDGTALLRSVHILWTEDGAEIEVDYWRGWSTQVFRVSKDHQKFAVINDCRICCRDLKSYKSKEDA